MHVEYVPGVENTTANPLSRLSQSEDYALKPEVLGIIMSKLQATPTMDWFATKTNVQLPRFCTIEKRRRRRSDTHGELRD
jgi:hypothetical protein